jgi:predicted GIY-YIG superfamily endonuclease
MKIWTFEKCREEALKYTTKIEFKKNSMSAYTISNRNGWMPEISTHMVKIGSKYKRCIYTYEFPDNHVYVGLTFNLNERQVNRDCHDNDKVTKYIKETNLTPIRKQLTDYVDVETAIKLEGEFLNVYSDNGWQILNVAKTGGIGGDTLFWTKEKCIDVAKKSKNRTEFGIKYRGAYSSSMKNGWISEIYEILGKTQKGGKRIHSFESCKEKATLCRTRAEFKIKFPHEFNAAYNNKWLNEICSHMINGKLKQNKKLYYE